MSPENNNFIEYSMTDYVTPHQQFNSASNSGSMDNLKAHPAFMYQDHINLGYIPTATNTNTINLLPQSPVVDPFQQCDESNTTDNTSCCTSPCSILSTASIVSSHNHTFSAQQFPTTPSPSPYQQHASENIMTTTTTRNNALTNATAAVVNAASASAAADTTSFYPDFLQQYASSSSSSSPTKETMPTFNNQQQNNFIVTHTSNKRKRFELEAASTSFLDQQHEEEYHHEQQDQNSAILINSSCTNDQLVMMDENDELIISTKDYTMSNSISSSTTSSSSSSNSNSNSSGGKSDAAGGGKLVNSELRRQIHIQSEQKRRAQIKDGFEDLRNELPSCLNKKMSKVALLHRTVQHIQHLKNTQMTILAELERLAGENEQLRKFQDTVLQKQQQSSYSSL